MNSNILYIYTSVCVCQSRTSKCLMMHLGNMAALTFLAFQVVTSQDLISPPNASIAEEYISLVSNMTSLAVPGKLLQTPRQTKSTDLHWLVK